MKIKKKKGFTLIELLIVVAIIAILAAIAIPQFAAYRIKGYNAAASSDIRNGKTAEEALYADFQAYGSTAGNGVITTSPATITTTDSSNQQRSLDTSLSNNVAIQAFTNVGAGLAGANYLIFTKHKQGDRIFAADSNYTTIQWYAGTNAVAGSDLPSQSGSFTSTAGVDITVSGWTAL
jgi:prepilin-type N-terminal cleavage/methylation domain-containing protein